MKVVCIGDSLTFGYGVRRSQCWVSLLQAHFPEDEFVNAGENGDTTAGMVARFGENVVSEHPDQVFIMGGTNDVFEGVPAEQTEANLACMLERCEAEAIRPIVLTMPPVLPDQIGGEWGFPEQTERADERLEEICRWIRTCGQERAVRAGGRALDIRSAFARGEHGAGKMQELFLDGVHMNAEGHQIVATEIIESGR